jgi:hypothetical protein
MLGSRQLGQNAVWSLLQLVGLLLPLVLVLMPVGLAHLLQLADDDTVGLRW